jgi:hypothetical protein
MNHSISRDNFVLIFGVFAALLNVSSCGVAINAQQIAEEHVISPTSKITGRTSKQRDWIEATTEQRARLAEQLGEDGAGKYASSKGWKLILDGTTKTCSQGPDQVYQGENGIVHVIEAKGGTGRLGKGYGFKQGSAEWAVKASERLLRSNNASYSEEVAAKAVLQAAVDGRLQVHVVETKHVLGEPVAAVLKQSTVSTKKAAHLAQPILNNVKSSSPPLASRARVATGVKGSKLLGFVGRAAAPVAVCVDIGSRASESLSIERKYSKGEISTDVRLVEHSSNVAGFVGGWSGAIVGAKAGAAGGSVVGTAAAPGVGTAIGASLGAASGAITGYFIGEVTAEAGAPFVARQLNDLND